MQVAALAAKTKANATPTLPSATMVVMVGNYNGRGVFLFSLACLQKVWRCSLNIFEACSRAGGLFRQMSKCRFAGSRGTLVNVGGEIFECHCHVLPCIIKVTVRRTHNSHSNSIKYGQSTII